jgi:hypothetical protein
MPNTGSGDIVIKLSDHTTFLGAVKLLEDSVFEVLDLEMHGRMS